MYNGCPASFERIQGLCVHVPDQSTMKTWREANDHCQVMGGHLLTFESVDQMIRVQRHLQQQGSIFSTLGKYQLAIFITQRKVC